MNCKLKLPTDLNVLRSLMLAPIITIAAIEETMDKNSGGGWWKEQYSQRVDHLQNVYPLNIEQFYQELQADKCWSVGYHIHHPPGVDKEGNFANLPMVK